MLSNIHLINVMLFDNHMAINIVNLIQKILHVLSIEWCDKVIFVNTNRQNTMINNNRQHTNIVTLLKKEAINSI